MAFTQTCSLPYENAALRHVYTPPFQALHIIPTRLKSEYVSDT